MNIIDIINKVLEVFKKDNLKYAGAAALIGAAIFLLPKGCDSGDTEEVTITAPSETQEWIKERQALLNQVASVEEERLILVGLLDTMSERKEYYKALYNDSKGFDTIQIPIFLDCLDAKDIELNAQQEIDARNKIIQALESQIVALKTELSDTDYLFSEIESYLSNLSKKSPFFNEQVSFTKLNGVYNLVFEELPPTELENEIDNIVDETFDFSHFKYGVRAGWGLNANFGDFSGNQTYHAAFVFRPISRVGLGFYGNYSSGSVKWKPSNQDRLGLGLLLEYNFGKK